MFLKVYFFNQKTQPIWKIGAPIFRTKLSNALEIMPALCTSYPVLNVLFPEGRGKDNVQCLPSCQPSYECLVLLGRGKMESFLCTCSPCQDILWPHQRQTTLLAMWNSYQNLHMIEGHLTHPTYFRDQKGDLWEGLTEAQQLKKLHLSSS